MLTPTRDLQVTHQALRSLPTRQALGAETRTVRIDAPPERRVARHAVLLGVARGAALQALPCCAAVLQQPRRRRVMKRHVQPALRREPRLTVTTAAEHLGVMARGAFRFAAIGIRRVALREVGLVKATRSVSGVAVGAELSCVARRAREGTTRCLAAVRQADIRVMHADRTRLGGVRSWSEEWSRSPEAGSLEPQLDSLRAALLSNRNAYQDVGGTGPDVAARARRARVTGGATVRVAAGDRTVGSIEPLRTVIGRHGVHRRTTRHQPSDAGVRA